MDEHELDFDDLVESNSYGMFAHFSESDSSTGHGTIYHYRNLEDEQVHIDVFEFHTIAGPISFEKRVDDKDVSEKERRWNAS